MNVFSTPYPIDALRAALSRSAARLTFHENASLAGYTTAHLGGAADILIIANSAGELEEAARCLWELEIPFQVLGYGSNVLVSDSGVRGAVIINRARAIEIDDQTTMPGVRAESGALIGTIARQTALRGLSGFEWAATVPGTLGGAVYGNAGAHGADMSGSLLLAEILHPNGKELWSVDRLQYQYRSSLLKREAIPAVILAAQIKLEHSDPQSVQAKINTFAAYRRGTQPPGASLGSIFKNPPGDYAGRLIEAAGLKGTKIGDAEISPEHANFFINHGKASAVEVAELIRLARQSVAEKFGVWLELEVELMGDWSTVLTVNHSTGAKPDHER